MSQPSSAPAEPTAAPSGSPFASLTDFVALPRIGALALSADGSRLAVSVHTLDAEKKKWQSALWEVDPAGERPARRLTRSAPGESSPMWAPDGSLLFTSARPDPGGQGERGTQAGAVEPARAGRRGPAGPLPAGRGRLVHGRRRQWRRGRDGPDHGGRLGRREGRGAAHAAQGRRGVGDPPRELPDPALGPRPRPRRPPPVLGGAAARGGTPGRHGRRRAAGPDARGRAALRCRRGRRAVPRRAPAGPVGGAEPTARRGAGRGWSSPTPAAASPACSWTTRWPTSTGRASRRTAPRWSACRRRCRPTPSRRTTRCCWSTWPRAPSRS